MASNLQAFGSQPLSIAQASNLKPFSLPPHPCDKEKRQAFRVASLCHRIFRFDYIGLFTNGADVYNATTTMFGFIEANKMTHAIDMQHNNNKL
jgi:hypothetical protein